MRVWLLLALCIFGTSAVWAWLYLRVTRDIGKAAADAVKIEAAEHAAEEAVQAQETRREVDSAPLDDVIDRM